MTGFNLIAVVLIFVLGLFVLNWRISAEREARIRTFVLPKGLYDKLIAKHPNLTTRDCQLVAQGLRQFFLTYLKSGRRYVSMPSQVADDLWHEFILYTKNYQQFCERAFGRFLHHTPAAVLGGGEKQSNAGLRRCWWHACREENINPRAPARLPLLFALDTKLNIPNGFRYAADCSLTRGRGAVAAAGAGVIYCGGDFSSASVDGGTDGLDDSGGSDGGSDGGSGCGGGGCGGGGD